MRRRHRLFPGHDYSYDVYHHVDKLNTEFTHYGVLYFGNERIQIFAPSESSFTICFQHGNFRFPHPLKVPYALRQLLSTANIVSKPSHQELLSYNVVLLIVWRTANWINGAQEFSKFNPTKTVLETVYSYVGAPIPKSNLSICMPMFLFKVSKRLEK